MRILFASHTAIGGPFVVGSHHLSRELSIVGHRVVHLSTAVSFAHLVRLRNPMVRKRFARALRGTHEVRENLAEIVPLTVLPSGRVRLGGRPVELPVTPWRKRVVRYLSGEPEIVLIDQPLLAPLALSFRKSAIVVRSTDVVVDPIKIQGYETVLPHASAIIGTSEKALAQLAALRKDLPRTVVRNGVEASRFFGASARPLQDRSGFVYVGALDERFDWEIVIRIAQNAPHERIDLYGPPIHPPKLPDNVKLRGAVPYKEVPHVLSQYRYGLLPLNRHPTNAGRSPMKLYEYLAAGLVVLSSHLDGWDRLPREVVMLPSQGDLRPVLDEAALLVGSTGGLAAAEAEDWSSKASELMAFVQSVTVPD